MFLKANRLGFHFNASITPEQSILFIYFQALSMPKYGLPEGIKKYKY